MKQLLSKLNFPCISAFFAILFSFDFHYTQSLYKGYEDNYSMLETACVIYIIIAVIFSIYLFLRKTIKLKTLCIMQICIFVAFYSMLYSYDGISHYYDAEHDSDEYSGNFEFVVWCSYIPLIIKAFIDFVLSITKICGHKKLGYKILCGIIIGIVYTVCVLGECIIIDGHVVDAADWGAYMQFQFGITPFIVLQSVFMVICKKYIKWLFAIFVFFITSLRITALLLLLTPLIVVIVVIRLIQSNYQTLCNKAHSLYPVSCVSDGTTGMSIVGLYPQPTITQAFKLFFSNYIYWSGRSRRSEFWKFLPSLLPSFLLLPLDSYDDIIPDFFHPFFGSCWVIGCGYIFVCLIPCISIIIRRLHDIGMSGWWACLMIAMIIGVITIPIVIVFIIVLFCIDGKPKPNQWGSSPKYIVG